MGQTWRDYTCAKVAHDRAVAHVRIQSPRRRLSAFLELENAVLPRKLGIDAREGVQLQLNGVAVCVGFGSAEGRGRAQKAQGAAQRARAALSALRRGTHPWDQGTP